MSEQTFEADSVEAALAKAAAALGVDATELDHEVVEKKEDFWGGGDTFVIKAWQPAAAEDEPEASIPKAAAEVDAGAEEEQTGEPEAQQQSAAPAEAPAEAAQPDQAADAAAEEVDDQPSAAGSDDEQESPAAAAEKPRKSQPAPDDGPELTFDPNAEGAVEPDQVAALLTQIFHDMEFDCTVDVEKDDDGFSATVSGADKEELLEGNGRCLSALELLVNNAFRNRMSRGDKIRVDAGNFRSRRDQELTDLAYQVAHSAKESGTTQETQELNPYERRLVHLALAEDQAVTTKSRGSGFLKNVQVIPQKQGQGGRGRRR